MTNKSVKYRVSSPIVAEMLVIMAKEKGIKENGISHTYDNIYSNYFWIDREDYGFACQRSQVVIDYQDVSLEEMIGAIEGYRQKPKENEINLLSSLTAVVYDQSDYVDITDTTFGDFYQIHIDKFREVVKAWDTLNPQSFI